MRARRFIFAILSLVILAAVGFGQETPTVESSTETMVSTKPEGTLRIGIVMPKLQVGAESSTAEAASAVREAMSGYLKGPTVDVVVIEAKSPTNAAIEAVQKSCDFVLFTTVSRKTKTSLFGSLVKAAVPVVAGQIQGSGSAGQASGLGEAKQAVADGGKEFVDNAVAVKFGARDEVSLEFTLTGADLKTPAVKGASSAKAKTDGEDVISTLIEQVSEKILQSIVKK